MSDLRDEFDDRPEPSIPQELRDDLRRLYAGGAVLGKLDDAVLTAARARFARLRQWRRLLRWGGRLTAAAVLAVALRVAWVEFHAPGQLAHQAVPTDREDLSGDGKVDILDAFLLARGLKDGTAPTSWDLNGDGQVDQGDVDLLAADAVSLKRGRMQ